MELTYIALIEEGSDESAFGVIFPDLPGCFSAGDTFEQAVKNAEEALSLYCRTVLEGGAQLPSARSLEGIKQDRALQTEFNGIQHSFTLVTTEMPAVSSYRPADQPVHGGFEEPNE